MTRRAARDPGESAPRPLSPPGFVVKKLLKVLGWSALVLLVVGAYAGYRNVRGHPFTLNQLARYRAILDGSRPRHLLREPEQHGGNAHLGDDDTFVSRGYPGVITSRSLPRRG